MDTFQINISFQNKFVLKVLPPFKIWDATVSFVFIVCLTFQVLPCNTHSFQFEYPELRHMTGIQQSVWPNAHIKLVLIVYVDCLC